MDHEQQQPVHELQRPEENKPLLDSEYRADESASTATTSKLMNGSNNDSKISELRNAHNSLKKRCHEFSVALEEEKEKVEKLQLMEEVEQLKEMLRLLERKVSRQAKTIRNFTNISLKEITNDLRKQNDAICRLEKCDSDPEDLDCTENVAPEECYEHSPILTNENGINDLPDVVEADTPARRAITPSVSRDSSRSRDGSRDVTRKASVAASLCNIEEEELDPNSVIVKNFGFKTTIDELKAHFSHCGVLKAHFIRFRDGKYKGQSSGNAFITLRDEDGMEKALLLNGTMLLERSLIVEPKLQPEPRSDLVPATPHWTTTKFLCGGNKQRLGAAKSKKNRKQEGWTTVKRRRYFIFVSNLFWLTNPSELQEFFSGCGVMEITMHTHTKGKLEGRPNGTASIELMDEKGVKKALQKHMTSLHGTEVMVKLARKAGPPTDTVAQEKSDKMPTESPRTRRVRS